MTGWLWSLATVLGPLLLLGMIVWVYYRNRKAGPANLARAERGARELREEIARDEAKDGVS